MILLLIKRDDEDTPITNPEAGILTGLRLPYITRYGFPVGFTSSQAHRYAQAVGSITLPSRGMVVILERQDDLYVVDIVGEAHPIGLKATRPESTPLDRVEPDVAAALAREM